MSYTILHTPSAEKQFRKFPKSVREYLYDEIQHLKNHPNAGEQLTGILRQFRSFHPKKFHNVHYRVLYEVFPAKETIIIRMIGIRENFYKRAAAMKLKPIPKSLV